MPVYPKLCRPRVSEPWVICTLCCSLMTVMFIQHRCVKEMLFFMRVPYDMRKGRVQQNYTEGTCPHYNPEIYKFEVGTGSFWSFEIVRANYQTFSLGFMIGQIPIGVLTDWSGPRCPLGLGMLLSSIVCLVLPSFTRMGFHWCMAANFILGIGQSVIFPCSISTVARCAPVSRRATWTGITFSGLYLGIGVGAVFYNIASHSPKLIGWKLGMYIPGLLGLALCLLWFLFSENPPLPSTFHVEDRKIDMPWEHLIRSSPFLSLLAAYMGHQWFQYVTINQATAGYLQYKLQVSVHLSHLAMIILVTSIPTTVAGGFLSDWLVENSFISLTHSRRLFVFLGLIVSPFLFAFVPLTGCDPEAYIALLVVLFYMKGLGEAAIYTNAIDLSPKHAGMLMGINNTVGVAVFMAARESFGTVLVQRTDWFLWQLMFFFTWSFIVIMASPFLKYSSAQEQQWTNRLYTTQPQQSQNQ